MLLTVLEVMANGLKYSELCMFAEKLADWLCAEHERPALRSVLEALRGGMERQSCFDKSGTVEVPVKLAILQQVAPLELLAGPFDGGPPACT